MANTKITGKPNNISVAWKPFFKLFPGYRNIIENILERNQTIIMQGYSLCPDERLNNLRAIWVAEIVENKVSLWHIYSDSEESRKVLGI